LEAFEPSISRASQEIVASASTVAIDEHGVYIKTRCWSNRRGFEIDPLRAL